MVSKWGKVDPSKCYRMLYPSVPAIVSSNLGRKVSAMPAVSIVGLSGRPALIGIAISRTHTTYKTLKRSRVFAVSWVSFEHLKELDALSKLHGYDTIDKLKQAGFKNYKTPTLDLIVPEEAVGILECKLVRDIKTGDHQFLVGRVVAAWATKDFKDYWNFKHYQPILYAGSVIGYTGYPRAS